MAKAFGHPNYWGNGVNFLQERLGVSLDGVVPAEQREFRRNGVDIGCLVVEYNQAERVVRCRRI